ncbi:MAG TPA: hypothetical protein VN364_10390 [Bellilinea sp.]|nr:hypothetical protein [Bellilinea sp.]
MKRFSKLMVWMSIVSLLSGCTLDRGAPTATSTAAPTTPLPIEASNTPPKVIVVSPTPGTAVPALEPTAGIAFCSDSRVQAAIKGLTAAVKNQDGAALAEFVDPVDGLDIYYRLANPPVHITPDEISGLFTSTFAYIWGDQAGSGLPVEGTFSVEVLPSLLDVFDRSFTQSCQNLTTGVGTGPTTALVDWPAEFADMPFVALFRAPEPQDNELDWRTWAVGFTVVNGQPKIRVLVQYVWEI